MNVTRNGTSTVKIMPLKTEIMAYSLPENLVIIGSVVSIAVAPPEAIGAILPKNFTKIGVINKVIISLKIFEIRATTPRASPLSLLINILERL